MTTDSISIVISKKRAVIAAGVVMVCGLAYLFKGWMEARDLANAKDLTYYRAHREEAKVKMMACQKMNPAQATQKDVIECQAADTAWTFQPYVATPPTFRSSGGKN